MKRQRQDFRAHARGNRTVGRRHMCERLLAWNRHGIVNECLDAVCGELPLKSVAIGNADDKQMIHVPGVALWWNFHAGVAEARAVARGEMASP